MINRKEKTMNKTELEKKLAHAKAGVEVHSHQRDSYLCDIRALETQLAELNKAKTGRVRIGDVIKRDTGLFFADSDGRIRSFKYRDAADLDNIGREFYDRTTAELFALREATEFKIWCEFGNDVVIVYSNLVLESYRYLGVNMIKHSFNYTTKEISNFLDTLSPKELNAIRSE